MRMRVRRRLFPLLASAGLMAVTMLTTTLGPGLLGRTQWALPLDYWGTMLAASRLAHLSIGGLYTQPTGLVSLPGTVVILLPLGLLINAAGLSLRIPVAGSPHPLVWLAGGPYQVALSCVALFAADAAAERLGIPRGRRALLAVAEGVALWNVAGRWGHPEDAFAVGLTIYALLALSQSRRTRAGWLAGAAICVQPLVLLAIPVLLAVLPWRRMPAFAVRAALPSAVLLGIAAAANWSATYQAVTSQPDSPGINHPTLWTALAPSMSGGNVAAGPARAITIVLACCCALAVRRRLTRVPADPEASWGTVDAPGTWPPELFTEVLWWAALTLALRSFFEPVMVSYYLWPALAVALIPATLTARRLLTASAIAAAITGVSQGTWRNPWLWWVPLIVALAAFLITARPRHDERACLGDSGNGDEHGVDFTVAAS
jgi:hypothetical protein